MGRDSERMVPVLLAMLIYFLPSFFGQHQWRLPILNWICLLYTKWSQKKWNIFVCVTISTGPTAQREQPVFGFKSSKFAGNSWEKLHHWMPQRRVGYQSWRLASVVLMDSHLTLLESSVATRSLSDSINVCFLMHRWGKLLEFALLWLAKWFLMFPKMVQTLSIYCHMKYSSQEFQSAMQKNKIIKNTNKKL